MKGQFLFPEKDQIFVEFCFGQLLHELMHAKEILLLRATKESRHFFPRNFPFCWFKNKNLAQANHSCLTQRMWPKPEPAMSSAELDVKSHQVRRTFKHICICYLHLFSSFFQLFVAVVVRTEVTLGTVIKYMCFSARVLSFAVLICTWKIVKYNSPFLPGSLALHSPII